VSARGETPRLLKRPGHCFHYDPRCLLSSYLAEYASNWIVLRRTSTHRRLDHVHPAALPRCGESSLFDSPPASPTPSSSVFAMYHHKRRTLKTCPRIPCRPRLGRRCELAKSAVGERTDATARSPPVDSVSAPVDHVCTRRKENSRLETPRRHR
jgi:hypothetical protein